MLITRHVWPRALRMELVKFRIMMKSKKSGLHMEPSKCRVYDPQPSRDPEPESADLWVRRVGRLAKRTGTETEASEVQKFWGAGAEGVPLVPMCLEVGTIRIILFILSLIHI